jgi:glutaminyl-peptide cyclotransferase
MAPRLIGQKYDGKLMLKYAFLPVVIAGLAGGLTEPIQQWFSPLEANAAMFDPPPPQPAIDGERAFGYLKKIVDMGPHTAGSDANTRVRKLVFDHFTTMGAKVREQPFRAVHPMTGEPLLMANLIASWKPDVLQRVVIGAHYDTRPHPDQEVQPERHNLPFLGANDPGSGIAVLMEIAHHLKNLDTHWGVDLVLFDGEELIFGDEPRVGEYFLGSEQFARTYADLVQGRRTPMRYVNGIVLDMVGGRNMRIKQEPNSLREAPLLMREVWAVAKSLGVKSFSTQRGREVRDDHLPLIEAGIPTVDLIDFDYPYWHKADDLPENCSAESLADVSRVVTTWLKLPPRPQQPRRRR